MHAHAQLSDNGFYSHLTIWISAPRPLIKLQLFFPRLCSCRKKQKRERNFHKAWRSGSAEGTEWSGYGDFSLLLHPSTVCRSFLFLLDNQFALLKFPFTDASVTFELL